MIARLIDKAMRLRAESKSEIIDFNLLVADELDRVEVARLWLLLGEWKTALNVVERAVSHQLVQLVDGKSIEVDGYLVFAKQGDTKEICVDEDGFWEAVLRNPDHLPRYFNVNYARKGSLPRAVRDTFFEKRRELKPDATPVPAAVPVEVLANNRTRNAG